MLALFFPEIILNFCSLKISYANVYFFKVSMCFFLIITEVLVASALF